jgi:hypothetical protein
MRIFCFVKKFGSECLVVVVVAAIEKKVNDLLIGFTNLFFAQIFYQILD